MQKKMPKFHTYVKSLTNEKRKEKINRNKADINKIDTMTQINRRRHTQRKSIPNDNGIW